MRIRKIVNGTPEQPRMTVFRSNKQIYVQFIDDLAGVTLATASSLDKEVVAEAAGKNKSEVAALVGTVYNESASTITATLKGCDVENTTVKALTYDFTTAGFVAFVYSDNNDRIAFENCSINGLKLYAPNVYNYHAAVYTESLNDDIVLHNEAEGVTVTNVTFENI